MPERTAGTDPPSAKWLSSSMVQMIPESPAPNGYHGEQVSTDPPSARLHRQHVSTVGHDAGCRKHRPRWSLMPPPEWSSWRAGQHVSTVSTDPPLAMTQEPESPAGMMPPQVVIIFNGSDDARKPRCTSPPSAMMQDTESPAARLHRWHVSTFGHDAGCPKAPLA